MDWATLVAAVTSSLGITAAGAYWLGQALVNHRLNQALEERKSELTQQLDAQKAIAAQDLERLKNTLQLDQARIKSTMDAEIRKQVESQLGEIAVHRQYEYEARRRLYVAIGPLRFQLLLACRDFVSRIQALDSSKRYELNLNEYFARSTVYRLLKPLALATLIEEQMALADFSVDKAAIDCLRFRRSITRILSGDELVGKHPKIDWSRQYEHAYADSLASVAQAMIVRPAGEAARTLRFDEFTIKVRAQGWASFSPLDNLLEHFRPAAKPILWLRLVAYASSCNALVSRQGQELGFRDEPFDTASMLSRSEDPFTQANFPELLTCMRELELVML